MKDNLKAAWEILVRVILGALLLAVACVAVSGVVAVITSYPQVVLKVIGGLVSLLACYVVGNVVIKEYRRQKKKNGGR
jgi:hypothetical protein